jgi:tetratricopeptide (TPR) repeat protein
MKKICIFFFLYLLSVPSFSLGEDLYEEQLNRGIKNSEPYSYLLIQQSKTDRNRAGSLLKEAQRYSPDFPPVYFELSKTSFSLKAPGLFETFDYIRQGIDAYKRNFWWSFMLTASLFTGIIISFIVSIFILILVRVARDMPLFFHDIKETRNRLFLLLSFVFAFLGPLYLLGCLLMLISFYKGKWDRVVFYLYILFLFVLPWVLNVFSLILDTSASGAFKAIVRVNESKGNAYALSLLRNGKDPVEIFSYALALKREGKYDDAIESYNKLIRKSPEPRTYNNLANCYFALNNLDKAKELYMKSKGLKPLPSALYNLSQAYRETLDFDKGDEYFLSAQALNREAVSQFRAIAGRNPNRLVIDETLSFFELLKYVQRKTVSSSTFGLSVLPPIGIPVIAFLMAVFFFISDRRFKCWAYRCKRCGKILCSKCEKHILWGHMCLQCYRSLVKIEELDAKERVARLLTVYEHRKKRRSTIKIISFLLPGLAQIYAGNILQGLIFMWPFLLFLFIPVMNTVFTIEMSGFPHFWLNLLSLIFLVIMYVLSNIVTRRRITKGWL